MAEPHAFTKGVYGDPAAFLENGQTFRSLGINSLFVRSSSLTHELINAANDQYPNIEFRKADLTDPELKLPTADFGFCCNVLLLPDLDKNIAMLHNAHRALKKNAAAVFVIPSLDSMLFYAWRLIEWNKKEGVKPSDIPDSEFSYFSGSKRDIFQGLIRIDGVITKHYSHPEIEVIFRDAGFKIRNIDRIEYEWTTEFADPPAWLKDPYPWDWLVEVTR